MVAIIDYDAGNIKSVEKAFEYLGSKALVTRDPQEIYKADHVVLPGVGAFGDAMGRIREYGLEDIIRQCLYPVYRGPAHQSAVGLRTHQA